MTVPITPIALRYKGYHGRYEADLDEGVLHGRVAGIKDVVTFVANNREDLEREFQISVDVYLEFCAESGVEPNPPGPEPSPAAP